MVDEDKVLPTNPDQISFLVDFWSLFKERFLCKLVSINFPNYGAYLLTEQLVKLALEYSKLRDVYLGIFTTNLGIAL
jgi:hypothetical protein